MPAPRGNKNAVGQRVRHARKTVSLSGPTLDLIYDALAAEGNADPSPQELADAVYYAVRAVYGRQLEEQEAIIL